MSECEYLSTNIHVLCLALQRKLKLADDGVLLPQRPVQVIFHILLGSVQVFQRVCKVLQLHILLLDQTVKTLK